MDFGFIRFVNEFQKAKQVLDNKDSKIRYNNAVVLSSNEKYLQITNSKTDITFNGNAFLEIVDCNDKIIFSNITGGVPTNIIYSIYEATDIFGIKQIALEFWLYDFIFNTPCFLRLTNTVNNQTYWSNPIVVSNESLETTIRIDYKSVGFNKSVDYSRLDFMQSIRLSGRLVKVTDETEIGSYTQTTGQKTVFAKENTFSYEYEVYNLTNFNYLCLSNALKNHIVYIDGLRCKIDGAIKSDGFEGNTNVLKANFKAFIDYEDVYNEQFQLIPSFSILSKSPTGKHTQSSFNLSQDLHLQFSRSINPITNPNKSIKLYDSTNTLIQQWVANDFVVTGGGFLDSQGVVFPYLPVGQYYFKIELGLITSILEEDIEITNNIDWVFEIINPDYEDNDYDNNDYLTT